MTGNQTEIHHIVPRGLRRWLARININVDAYAWNTMTLPNNRALAQASGLPQHGFFGNHTAVGYSGGVERVLESIVEDTSLTLPQQKG